MNVMNLLKDENRRRPQVVMGFGPLKIPALADSGSQITIISQKDFNSLAHKPLKLTGPIPTSAATGDDLKITGTYEMTVDVMGRSWTVPVCVAVNLVGKAIMGMDLMKFARMVIDTEENKVYYKDEYASVYKSHVAGISTRTELFLPARSAQKVVLKANFDDKAKVSAEVLGVTCFSQFPGCPFLTSEDSLVKTDSNGNVSVLAVNHAPHDLRIPRGTRLGEFQPLTSDQYPLTLLDEVLDQIPEAEPPKKTPPPAELVTYIKSVLKLLDVPEEERQDIIDLVTLNYDIVSRHEWDMGKTNTLTHKLHLTDDTPVYWKQYPFSRHELQQLNHNVDHWMKLGVAKYINSEYNAPALLVPKRSADGSLKARTVIDFRGLNEKTIPSNYRLRTLPEAMEAIGRSGATRFTALDLRQGFWHLPLHPESQHLCAFTVPGRGQFTFTRAPQGLRNVPLSFQRLMDICFRGMGDSKILTFIDDILCMARTHKEMLEVLQQAFNRLRAHGLKLNLEKCKFSSRKLEYLGHIITPDGYTPSDRKIKAIADSEPPTTVKLVRSWLGLVGFFRDHLPNYSTLVKPLTDLTRKNSHWAGGSLPPKAKEAFEMTKALLCQKPILAFAKPTGKYHLFCDGSEHGYGAILMQEQGPKRELKVVSYGSTRTKEHERNYDPFLLEQAAIAWAMDYFKMYLTGQRFTCYSDHKPLTKLSKIHTKTLHRIQEKAMHYDFEVSYWPGMAHPSDFLSRNAVDVVCSVEQTLFSFDKEQFTTAQNEDVVVLALKNFALYNTIPNSPALKSLVTKFGKQVSVEDDLVYIVLERDGHLKQSLLIAPALLHADIIANAHGRAITGHLGQWKTAERILTQYWWPGLHQDVEEAIHNCNECQRSNITRHRNAPLGDFDHPHAPLVKVHCDTYGPLIGQHGNKAYIAVMCDAYTKYCKFRQIPNKNAETVARIFFSEWCLALGPPAIVVSDQGGEWVNTLVNELYKLLKIDKRQTTAQHPKANATVENRLKHFSKFLMNFTDDNPRDWEHLLPYMEFAWNISVNKATKMSPSPTLWKGLIPSL